MQAVAYALNVYLIYLHILYILRNFISTSKLASANICAERRLLLQAQVQCGFFGI